MSIKVHDGQSEIEMTGYAKFHAPGVACDVNTWTGISCNWPLVKENVKENEQERGSGALGRLAALTCRGSCWALSQVFALREQAVVHRLPAAVTRTA